MRLVRFGEVGVEVPGVLAADDVLHDASGLVRDWDETSLSPENLARVATALVDLPTVGGYPRLGAPIARPGKVVCIGLNYSDHAEETGAAIPSEPVLFFKDPRTVVGPRDDVLVPRNSVKTDYEVELGVVIGSTARYLDDDEEALACVAGYALSHDVSEREFQLERGGQWDKGKSCETFNPLGPWLSTADEIADPQDLRMQLSVNAEPRQDGSTATMVFGVAEIVRYLSRFMVLYPGDLINTGTPAGVALGKPDPKPYLRAGDVVECSIAGLGSQRSRLVQA